MHIYNEEGETEKAVGAIPLICTDDKFQAQHSHGFLGKLTHNTNTNHIYIAPIRSDLIEKYDIEGNLISTLHGPERFYPNYKIVPAGNGYTITYTNKTRFGYTDICYNQKLNKTFLLYSGRYILDKKKNKERKSTIFVLDNSDNLTEEITTNYNIRSIRTHPESSAIYSLTEDHIIKFKYE